MFGKTEKKPELPEKRYVMKEMQYVYGDVGVILFVDTQTGVNYMMSTKGSEMTVALNSDGEPLIDEDYLN